MYPHIWSHMSIGGSEWIIIVFVALVLVLGTNKLPEAARKIGKAAAEYKRARDEVETQINSYSEQKINVKKPVENERQKFEAIAESLDIDAKDMSIEELKDAIQDRIGKKADSPPKA